MLSRRIRLVALFAVAFVHCRQVIGIDDPHALSPCDSCTVTSCASERSSCDGDAICTRAFACFDACKANDTACLVACAEKSAFSKPMTALAACRAKSCESACGIACGGLFPRFLPRLSASTRPGSAACAACLDKNTCELATACGKSQACTYGFACREASFLSSAPALDLPNREACDRAACHDACPKNDALCNGKCDAAVFDTSLAPRTSLDDKLGSCADECALGTQWGCIGKVKLLPTHVSEGELRFYVRVLESEGVGTVKPLVDARVRACNMTSDCTAPQAEGRSDANGFLRMRIPSPLAGFHFNGYIEASKEGYPLASLAVTPLQLFDDVNPLFGKTELPVITKDAVSALSFALRAELGHLLALSFDCEFSPAPHVIFHWQNSDVSKTDASRVPFHYPPAGSIPVTGKTDDDTETVITKVGADSGVAVGGFLNLDPGVGTLTAALKDGTKIATITAPVRASAITIVTVVPTP